MINRLRFMMLAALAVLVTACGSDDDKDSLYGTGADANSSVLDRPISEEELAQKEREWLAKRENNTVYFAFDSHGVDAGYNGLVEKHAQYLLANPGVMVNLEGHCDERGTPEYNIGLGDRRVKAVQRLLLGYGVLPQQIRGVSFGEEKPAVLGHSESAWSKNRRVEIRY